jgi:antitoxin CptB
MTDTTLANQLKWQCRRGMLELDVILIPFLAEHFEALDQALQNSFAELLKQADPDLYTWIMGFGQCEHAELVEIIQLIRQKMSIA